MATLPPGGSPNDESDPGGHRHRLELQVTTDGDGRPTTTMLTSHVVRVLRDLVNHARVPVDITFSPEVVGEELPIETARHFEEVVTAAVGLASQQIVGHLTAMVDSFETKLIEAVSDPEVAAELAGRRENPPKFSEPATAPQPAQEEPRRATDGGA
jgi:hypothetical protein